MNKQKEVSSVAVFGILGNVVLLASKLTIGFLSNSQAMIADGLNSAGDVFASVITFIGNMIAEKPGDEDHPYGHGKAEYIFSMIISFSLLLVAFTIFRSAFDSIINKEIMEYSVYLILVAVMTIIIKIVLYIHSYNIGKKYNSLLALSNAMDHRNDILISALTLVSIILSRYNIFIVDGIVGILIAFWIAYTAFDIFSSSYMVLMDTNIDSSIMEKMELAVGKIHGVDHLDSIHAQPIGLKFILIVKVSIDANLTVLEGHSISAKVKDVLLTFEGIDDAIVHVNPAQFHPQR